MCTVVYTASKVFDLKHLLDFNMAKNRGKMYIYIYVAFLLNFNLVFSFGIL